MRVVGVGLQGTVKLSLMSEDTVAGPVFQEGGLGADNSH